MNIELYSVKGFTGNALMIKLRDALANHHLAHTVTEINHVDQFIKEGLTSVPAIKVGEKVIQHPHDGVPDETVQNVIDYLLNTITPSILVPVDFSDESRQAIHYATMMAHHLDLGLTLVHVHQTFYDPISSGSLDVHFLKENQHQLMELVEELKADNRKNGMDFPVQTHIEVGETITGLVELLEQEQFEMMIIGTKATDNVIRRIFGTISGDVSRKSNKPVIVIPPGFLLKFPGKMVVGFTDELLLDGVLENILNFGAKQNVFFDFVHITDDHARFNKLKDRLYQKLVIHRRLTCGFNIRSLADDQQKIHDILFEYAHLVRAGMVILVTHHRHFLEDFFHASVTKKALQHPDLPLMILHQSVSTHQVLN